MVLLDPRIRRAVALHHRDRLDAAADRRLDALLQHHVRGLHDRLQTRVAEAIDGDARRGHRQAGPERGDARDVVALGAVRLPASENDFLDLRWIRAAAPCART